MLMFVGVACLAGCSDGGWKASLGAGGQGVLAARGEVSASQAGNVVVVEVRLSGVPQRTRLLAMGLKLRDGTAIYPSAVRILPGLVRDSASSPGVRFGFDGSPVVTEGQSADLSFQMHYELEEGSVGSVGSVFWLALGEPDGPAGTEAGITCGLSLDDGTPFFSAYGMRLSPGAGLAGLPALAEPRRSVPMVGFHLDESLVTSAAGRVVSFPPDGVVDNVLLSKRVRP
jgi:hypothetical protein